MGRSHAVEARRDDLFGGAGVGGALKHDQLAGVQVRRDRLDRGDDVAHVRRVVRVQRRGHADEDRVERSGLAEVGGGAKAPALCRGDVFGLDAMDVRLTRVELSNLLPVDVEARNAKSLLAEQQRQRQADVAEADDPHACGALVDAIDPAREAGCTMARRSRPGWLCLYLFTYRPRSAHWLSSLSRCLPGGTVPRHRAPQPFLEADADLIPERLAGRGDVCV